MRRMSPHAVTTWLLVAALSLFAIAGTRISTSGIKTYEESELLYNGDLALKASTVSRWAAKNYNKPAEYENMFFRLAYAFYKTAASNPNASPDALRRIGVLTGSPEYFKKLTSSKILQGKTEVERKELESEKAMWLAIYSKQVHQSEIKDFDRRIRTLGLGSATYYALSDLYEAAGQFNKAAAIDREAERQAVATFWPIVLIGILMVIALPFGFFVLIWFTMKWNRDEMYKKTNERPMAVSDQDSLYLSFNFYLIAMLAISALGIMVIQPKLSMMESNQRATWDAVYMLFKAASVGGLATLVMSSLLKGKNFSLRDIGLSADNLWKNVLWGIVGYCAMAPLILTAERIWRDIQKFTPEGIDTPVNPITSMFASSNTFAVGASLVSAVLLAPLFEEIFFRGALYQGMRVRQGFAVSALASAAAFAIMHPFPASFLPVFIMGMGFAVMMEARRSLVPAITAHAIHNGLSFLMLFLLSR